MISNKHEVTDKYIIEAKQALNSINGITGIRGAAASDLTKFQDKEDSDQQEINQCLNSVTCRIM